MSREDLNHTSHCVRAIQHAGRSSYDLDAIDVVRGEIGEVDGAPRIVHHHAVDEHLRIVALTTAQEHGGLLPE